MLTPITWMGNQSDSRIGLSELLSNLGSLISTRIIYNNCFYISKSLCTYALETFLYVVSNIICRNYNREFRHNTLQTNQ